MSDLEVTTAIACFALVIAILGFVIGSIYNSRQIEKLDERISNLEINKNSNVRIITTKTIASESIRSFKHSIHNLYSRVNALEQNAKIKRKIK